MLSDAAVVDSRRRFTEGDNVMHISRGIGKFTSYVDGHAGIGMVKFENRKYPVACWLVDLEPTRPETNFDKVMRVW